MNLYEVYTKEDVRYVDDVVEGRQIWLMGTMWELVAAETPGQAKADFIAHCNHEWRTRLEFTDGIAVRRVRTGIDRARGVLDYSDPLAKEYEAAVEQAHG
jgi:hypothetical protein